MFQVGWHESTKAGGHSFVFNFSLLNIIFFYCYLFFNVSHSVYVNKKFKFEENWNKKKIALTGEKQRDVRADYRPI